MVKNSGIAVVRALSLNFFDEDSCSECQEGIVSSTVSCFYPFIMQRAKESTAERISVQHSSFQITSTNQRANSGDAQGPAEGPHKIFARLRPSGRCDFFFAVQK